jgi:hypothetical protein
MENDEVKFTGYIPEGKKTILIVMQKILRGTSVGR